MNGIKILLCGMAAAVLPSCNGIFEGLYDPAEYDSRPVEGFVQMSSGAQAGRIYVDATDYAQWIYLDFSEQSAVTLAVAEAEPADWDMAIHRYDVKTNGGEAAQTEYESLQEFAAARWDGSGAQWQADEWFDERIAVDMSQMMSGTIVCMPSFCNDCLSRWLDVDTSTMPPVYTISPRVYAVRFGNGECAALRLADYTDANGVKGFMTVEFLYPMQF